jgi:hypothetical protein
MKSVLIAIALLAALALAVPASALTWDIHSSFAGANPNGPWTYGYRINTPLSGDFYQDYNYGYYSTWGGWNDPGDPRMWVFHRFSDSWDGVAKWYIPFGFMEHTVAGDILLSGSVSAGPEGSTIGTVRFTAPQDGLYSVAMNFEEADNRYPDASGPAQSVWVVVNGQVVGSSPITGWGQSYSFAATTYSLTQGATVEFITDKYMPIELNGGVTLVPEPGTMLTFAASLGALAGFALRRRR